MSSFFQYLLIILLNFTWIQLCHATVDAQLEKTIRHVVLGFEKRDAQYVKPYIHPKHGYIHWYRIGIPTIQSYEQQKDFRFPSKTAQFPNIWFYTTPNRKTRLEKTQQLPIMECDLWNKSGWFYQQPSHKKAFSTVLKDNYRDQLIDQDALKKGLAIVQPLEKHLVDMYYVGKSRQVDDSLHLYFSQINGQWYFSGFDNAGNCDVQ